MPSSTVEKKRGTLLTFLLFLALATNLGAALFYLVFSNTWIAREWYDIPVWAMRLVGVLALLNVSFVVFIFKWKRWAFYALVTVAAVNLLINLFGGFGFGLGLAGLVWPSVIYFFIRRKRELFE